MIRIPGVVHRARIGLPQGALFRVRLENTATQDTVAPVLAETEVVTSGEQVPIPVAVDADRSTVGEHARLELRVTLEVDGQLRFTTTSHVSTPDHPDGVELLGERFEAPPPPLEDKEWLAVELDGELIEIAEGEGQLTLVLHLEESRGATQRRSSPRAASAGSWNNAGDPVPSPTIIPFSTSSAAASTASRFSPSNPVEESVSLTQPVEHSPERELKLAADTAFRMPSIYGLGGTSVRSAPPERNATTYYDTEDLRLARWGASLRHRPGEGWTVKLPAERDAPFLVRPEIVFEGNGGRPPQAALELVRGFIRDEELRVRVRMTTIRRRTGIHDSGGRLIGGVVDDAVSVLDDESPSSFRELEVEIGDDMTPALLDALVQRLRQAGAGSPAQTAKYIRALGTHAPPLTPEVPVSDLAADATTGDVVRRAIALSVIRLILHDPVVRLDLDAEGVHQARVATRRLRSDLRTFRSLVEPGFASAVRDELGWLAALLGEVRDGDVLVERLHRRAAALPEHERAGTPGVLATLEVDRNTAHARLLETLRSRRYFELLERLVAAANAPALLDEAGAPALDVVPGLVRRPWNALAKRVKALDERPTDAQLHEIRIRTKRVRYAVDAAAPIVGKPARSFARAAAGLQEVLGDLNDAVVAARWLDEWGSHDREPAEVRAAEALAAAERAEAARLRARWHAAWEKLAVPELRTWM